MHTYQVENPDYVGLDSAVFTLESGQPITVVDLRLVLEESADASGLQQTRQIGLMGRTVARIKEGDMLNAGEAQSKPASDGSGARMLVIDRVRRLERDSMQWLEFRATERLPNSA
jgi:hypothetical protein